MLSIGARSQKLPLPLPSKSRLLTPRFDQLPLEQLVRSVQVVVIAGVVGEEFDRLILLEV